VSCREDIIDLGKRLRASLRISYVVDLQELKVSLPTPPWGAIHGTPVRGGEREAKLVAQGREYVAEFGADCEAASAPYSGAVLVGRSEELWAGAGRACDLILTAPIESDFGRTERVFGSMFLKMAARASRPVLLQRPNGSAWNGMVLLHSNQERAAAALPWVVEFCGALDMVLTVCAAKDKTGEPAEGDPCRSFLDRHNMSGTFLDKKAIEVLEAEARRPGSELPSGSLLVLDGGFGAPWFRRRRRLAEKLIRSADHSVLLCP
jgi:hypothetical protein